MQMSVKEAIEKMGCEENKCPHLDIKRVSSFCTVLRTKEFCKNVQKDVQKNIKAFNALAEKYGFFGQQS